MGEVKHTPGPWEYIDATKVASMQYAPACVIKSGNKQISRFSWNDDSPFFPNKEESQANARLIAAAPEMLEALKALLDRYHIMGCGDGPEALKAQHAISKAEDKS